MINDFERINKQFVIDSISKKLESSLDHLIGTKLDENVIEDILRNQVLATCKEMESQGFLPNSFKDLRVEPSIIKNYKVFYKDQLNSIEFIKDTEEIKEIIIEAYSEEDALIKAKNKLSKKATLLKSVYFSEKFDSRINISFSVNTNMQKIIIKDIAL